MDYLNDPVFGTLDLIGGIDNEAFDLDQFEAFIQNSNSSMNMNLFGNENINNPSTAYNSTTTSKDLPESPPDSGSETPYSPKQNVSEIINNNIISLSDISDNDLIPVQNMFLPSSINNSDNVNALNVIPSQDLITELTPELCNINESFLLLPNQKQQEDFNSNTTASPPPPTIHNIDETNFKSKKRKLSDSLNLPDSTSINCQLSVCNEEEGNAAQCTDLSTAIGGAEIIKFSPFQKKQWYILCDQNLQEIPPINYRISADKGFLLSAADDAYVCQKKNHFQITCQIQLLGDGCFVRTTSGLLKVRTFNLFFFGVKWELPEQRIRIEQSQTDRSKKPFLPVVVDLKKGVWTKLTIGRLHFAETTANNMRKKGRSNPDQRYFQLVISLHAATHSGTYPIISYGSEKIIVRASNPGLFENDMNSLPIGINNNISSLNCNISNNVAPLNELNWQHGESKDTLYHLGRIGINTNSPDESLVVHGNIKISGHIIQPSDSRAKEEISELDSAQQLANVQKIRVVRYRYNPEFARLMNQGGDFDCSTDEGECLKENMVDTGVLAQEIQQVLPDAVKEGGALLLPNGELIDNFLLVNKDRIFMENIGAVKELCKITGSLETRIEQLERINAHIQRYEKKKKFKNRNDVILSQNKKLNKNAYESDDDENDDDLYIETCSNKVIQIIIIILVIVMAICLAAISTLYFIEHNHRVYNHFNSGIVGNKNNNRNIIINSRNSTSDNGGVYGRNGNGANYFDQTLNRIDSYDTRFTLKTIATPTTTASPTTKVIATAQPPPPVGVEESKIKKIQQQQVILKKRLEKDNENVIIQDDNREAESPGIDINKYKVHENVPVDATVRSTNNSRNSSSSNFYVDSDSFDSNAIDTQHHRDTNKTNVNIESILHASVGEQLTTKDNGVDNGYDLQNLAHNNGVILDTADEQLLDEDDKADDTIGGVDYEKVIILPILGQPPNCAAPNSCISVCCKTEIECNKTLELLPPSTTHAPLVPKDSKNMHDYVEISTSKFGINSTQTEKQEMIDNDERPVEIIDDLLRATTPISNLNSSNRELSTSNNNKSLVPVNCVSISMIVRSNLNMTLSENLICDDIDSSTEASSNKIHNLTFSIEISRYMYEDDVKLSFISQPSSLNMEWYLCQTFDARSMNDTSSQESSKMINSLPQTFAITIPKKHSFESLYVFRAPLAKIDNTTAVGTASHKEICQSPPTNNLGNYLQYNLKFNRKCDQ